jgi:hypothetical protein
MAQHRLLPATGLRLADYETLMENPSKPYPFRLEGAGSTYQNAIYHLFANHIKRDHVTNLYMVDRLSPISPCPW